VVAARGGLYANSPLNETANFLAAGGPALHCTVPASFSVRASEDKSRILWLVPMPGYRMLAYRGAAFGEINTAVHLLNAKRGAA